MLYCTCQREVIVKSTPMGQYYIFYNVARREAVKRAFANFKKDEISWSKIMKVTGWKYEDVLVAFGDYDDIWVPDFADYDEDFAEAEFRKVAGEQYDTSLDCSLGMSLSNLGVSNIPSDMTDEPERANPEIFKMLYFDDRNNVIRQTPQTLQEYCSQFNSR